MATSPRRMARRTDPDDEASEALLNSMMESAESGIQNQQDNPFVDEDGDLRVVPTMEELSVLLDGASSQALPMREILRRSLRVTLRAIEMAELAYHANPRQGTATALTQMQNLAKDTIKAIEERQDATILCGELMELVVKPLVMDFVRILTSEAGRKRSVLMTVVSPEDSRIVTTEINNLLQGVSQGCDDAIDDARRRLEDLLGAKK